MWTGLKALKALLRSLTPRRFTGQVSQKAPTWARYKEVLKGLSSKVDHIFFSGGQGT